MRILIAALRAQGVEVIECHANQWQGIEDKSQIKGWWRWVVLAAKIILAYPTLIYRYLRLPRHDAVLVCYPALIDLFVLRPFSYFRAPLIWDWFLSAYDTIVLDRKLLPVKHPISHLARLIEWLAVRTVDGVFMDTSTHARRMEQIFKLPEGRVGHVFVGAENAHFDRVPAPAVDGSFTNPTVLFYGQFIPLHGVKTIIEAARLLENHPIDWMVIGDGQEGNQIDHDLQTRPIRRLTRIKWVDYATLHQVLRRATVALGIFGTSEKAASVIPNKAFQILLTGCPLITRDSPAIRELLQDAPPHVQLVCAGDPRALAEAVLHAVSAHPEHHPNPSLLTRFDQEAIGEQLRTALAPHIGSSP